MNRRTTLVAVHSTAMPLNFFSFPGEIRNKIYRELLVLSHPVGINVATSFWYSPYEIPPAAKLNTSGLCLALLYVSKRVYSEASSLFYSENCFMLSDLEFPLGYPLQSAIFTSFLDRIGRQNASFLHHLCIAFPALDDYHLGRIPLKEDSIRTLELIRLNCPNITTLETSLETTTAMEEAINALDSPRAATKVLALVDARFKAISSLKEVIVNVDDEPPNDDLRKKIRDYAWTIKVTVYSYVFGLLMSTTSTMQSTATTIRSKNTMPSWGGGRDVGRGILQEGT
jgi:hypothetical protein